MAENNAEVIAHLIECLRNSKTAEDAWYWLVELELQALPLLQQFAVSERDEEIRATLVEVIWQHRNPESIPFLAQMLTDPGKKVWKAALDGLVTLGTDDALVALKVARAGASAEQLEYVDEAIDQIEHPESWLCLKPECSGSDEISEPSERASRWLIEAKVKFLSPSEGGRDHPAENSSAYRPHLVVNDPDRRGAIIADEDRPMTEDHLAVSFSGEGGPLLPNQTYDVRLLLIFYPHPAYNALVPGASFTIREGSKIVGYGRVTKGIDEKVANVS